MLIGTIVNVYLIIIHDPPDRIHRKVEKTSEILHHHSKECEINYKKIS